MYRGKKLYKYLKSREDNEDECAINFASNKDFLVQRCSNKRREYLIFDSCESFFAWYIDIPEKEKSFFEVIRNGKQKFRIDLDYKDDNIDSIKFLVTSILESIGITNPKLLIFDIVTSYHIILINYCFPSYDHCKYIASVLSEKIKIDMGVYGKIQHFRIEGCTKFGQERWKRRIEGKCTINNFHEGIISSTKNTISAFSEQKICRSISYSQALAQEVPDNFSIRWKRGSLIVLDRKNPSFCDQCNRNHDNENAFILSGRFYCRRKYSTIK